MRDSSFSSFSDNQVTQIGKKIGKIAEEDILSEFEPTPACMCWYMRAQIQKLTQQHNKVVAENISLTKKLCSLQNNNETQRQLIDKNINFQRVKDLIKEIDRIKSQIIIIKTEHHEQTTKLKNKLIVYNQKQAQQEWKEEFITLFVNMSRTMMGGDMQEDWSTRKKVRIGWKVIKNMIDKAVVLGVEPPRVQSNRYYNNF